SDHPSSPRGASSADEQLQILSDRLSLTEEQKPKVRQLIEDQHTQMQKVIADESMSRDDKMTKVRSIHESGLAQLKGMLTDEQKKKFDDWQQEMRGARTEPGTGTSNPK